MILDIPATTNAAGAETLPISGIELDLSGATQYGAGFGVTDLRHTYKTLEAMHDLWHVKAK